MIGTRGVRAAAVQRLHWLLAAVVTSNGVLLNASASDERLVELLQENLANAGIDDSALRFTELDGVVTLVGRVASGQVKANVLDLVRRTHGVIRIVDEISTDY